MTYQEKLRILKEKWGVTLVEMAEHFDAEFPTFSKWYYQKDVVPNQPYRDEIDKHFITRLKDDEDNG